LRATLEERFHADLGTVRVHSGPEAAATVDSASARAFTAGRHIFLGNPSRDWRSAQALPLLAHEVAHVLQQTGRLQADGCLHATDVSGGGPVQREPLPLSNTTPVPTLEQVAEWHRAAAILPGEQGLVNYIDDFLTALRAQGQDNVLDRLAGEVLQPELSMRPEEDRILKLSWKIQAFAYDCLKVGGRWAAAAKLLSGTNDLRTTFYSHETYQAYATMPELANRSWVSYWEREPFFAGFRPSDFAFAILQFLLGPTRDVLAVEGWREHANQAEQERLAVAPVPRRTELYFVAIEAVRLLDRFLRDKLSRLIQEVAGPGVRAPALTPRQRRNVTERLLNWARTLEQPGSGIAREPDEVQALLRAFAPQLALLSQRALEVWDAIASLEQQSIEALGRGERTHESLQLLQAFGERADYSAFRREFAPRLAALLALDEDSNIPSREDYRRTWSALRQALRPYAQRHFELPMLGMIRTHLTQQLRQAQPVVFDTRRIHPHLWMVSRILELIAQLDAYDPQADATFEQDLLAHTDNVPEEELDIYEQRPQPGVPDHRIRSRVHIASWLLRFASLLGWNDLRSLAEAVLTARQGSRARSQLALFGQWEPSPDAPLGRLLEDFNPDSPLGGLAPFTVRHFVDFFQRLQNVDMETRIRQMLATARRGPGLPAPSIVARALRESTQQFLRPRRYVNEPSVQVIRPGDEPLFSRLVEDHPSTRAFLAGSQDLCIYPTQPARPVFLWRMPSLANFVSHVRAISGIEVVDEYYLERQLEQAPAEETAPGAPRPPDWLRWLLLLDEALVSGGAGQEPLVQAAIAAMGATLTREREAQQRQLEQAAREATTYERTVRVGRVLRPLLLAYRPVREFESVEVDTGSGPQRVLRYSIPDQLITEIDAFIGHVYPSSDQQAQTVALFLELADLLSLLLGVEPGEALGTVSPVRYAVIAQFLPLLQVVIRAASESNNRQAIDAVLTATERTQAGWFDTRLARLREISDALARMRATSQRRFGFQGHNQGGHQRLESVGPGSPILPNHPFTIDGITYRLREVKASFVYHPPYGTGDARLDPVLTVAGRTLSQQERASDSTPLFVIQIGPASNTRTITANQSDDALLQQISHAVEIHAIAESLRELGEAIQGITEFALEVGELVPGVGQAITITRLFTFLMEFVEGGEMDELIGLIRRDPRQLLEEAIQQTQSFLQPPVLWEFLLFGNNQLDRLRGTSRADASRHPLVTRTRSGKLARVVRRIYGFGRGLAGSFGRVQTVVRRQSERTQMWIISQRYLPPILRFMSDNLPRLSQLAGAAPELIATLGELETNAAGVVEDPTRAMQRAMAGFPERLGTMVNSLSMLRLPENILPISDILDIVLDIAVRRLGVKYRIGAQVILRLLDSIGKRQELLDAIGRRLTGVFDPNEYYRQLVRGEGEGASAGGQPGGLEGMLKTARDELLGSLFLKLSEAAFLPESIRATLRTEGTGITQVPFHIQFEGSEFEEHEDEGEPEVEGYRASLNPRGAWMSHVGEGQPLPTGLRRDAEVRFGHDFGHVRLHSGGEGSRVAGRFGATALSSGSHVFLGAGLSPTDGGSRVLHHELTHVLQQAGPRPLGLHHDSRAVPGTPGRGLRYEPTREATADRIATEVARGPARRPVDAGAPGARGLQPSMPDAFIGRVLELLVSSQDISRDTAEVDATGTGTRGHLPPNIQTQVDGLWSEFTQMLRGRVQYDAPFGDINSQINVPVTIRRYLIEREGTNVPDHATAIREALRDIAVASLRTQSPPTGASTGSTPPPVQELDIDYLEAALGRYILGRTGILLHLRIARPHPEPPTPLRLAEVVVKDIHLPTISSNSNLFQYVVDTLISDYQSRHPTAPAIPRDRWLRWLQSHLAGTLGPSVWQRRRYALRPQVADDVFALIQSAATSGHTPLRASEVPPARYYTETGWQAPTSQVPASLGQIGLRVGLFGESLTRTAAARSTQRGRERESHHITQYLLLQFFSNKHDTEKAFTHAGSPALYPGMTRDGSRVTGIGSDIQFPTSVVGESEQQRGPGMPAILIAAQTHRTGNLHVTPQSDEIPGVSASTPAAIVREWYREGLRNHVPRATTGESFDVVERGPEAGLATYMNTPPPGVSPQQHHQRVHEGIVRAMRATYRQMRDRMQPRLRDALFTVEREQYYNRLVSISHPNDANYTITNTQLERVWATAVQRNREVMEVQYGWDRSS
jgi:hypothetical protein